MLQGLTSHENSRATNEENHPLLNTVPRLSNYIAKNGCTATVQNLIQNVLDEEFGGRTTAFVNALRSLDVATTPVAALGACLEMTVSTAEDRAAVVKRGEVGGR